MGSRRSNGYHKLIFTLHNSLVQFNDFRALDNLVLLLDGLGIQITDNRIYENFNSVTFSTFHYFIWIFTSTDSWRIIGKPEVYNHIHLAKSTKRSFRVRPMYSVSHPSLDRFVHSTDISIRLLCIALLYLIVCLFYLPIILLVDFVMHD